MGYEPKSQTLSRAVAAAGTRNWAPPLPDAPQVAVWDLGVRLFHWMLVGCVSGALLSGYLLPERWFDLHIAFGAAVVALIAFRLVWGFCGTRHARFANFVVGPAAVLRHLKALLAGRAGHHTGHNPLGAVMIVALLVMLALLIASGLIALGGELKQGPLAPFTHFATGHAAEEIHEALAGTLIALIALHVVGVAIESLRLRENLVRSMLTGRKCAAATDGPRTRERNRPLLAATILGLLTAAAVASIIYASNLPALGMPAATLDPVYARECAACHAPHHPSLAPATVWRAVIAGLDDHFGDNASLDGATAARLTAYLTADSAELWDSKPAHLFRRRNPAQPLRITATPAWRRIHSEVPAAAFAAKAVGGRLNCAACHADAASGRFAPQAIAIPQETTEP